ncbi:FCD domain-containing protein [Hydrogenoanaerobacterium sp.]|uniref:FadR/GntR family transcriptional regulator n=1 Tax=Hydrogenoanaerobacterium sp. TaxID=2953763 RepID=UPI002896BF61|nr:FCD domain-containing protein [Hydrogenoanaerobacterium sp.]
MAYSVQAANIVFNYIVQKIKTGEWLPGTKIETEVQLCEKLNVSRIAVRQALEKLSTLSVLRKVQGSGTYVEEFENATLLGLPYFATTRRTMITILEFRRMFDSYNAELFISKYTDEDLKLLEQNYEEMKKSVHDRKKFRYCDNEFHQIIAKGTRNAIIAQISNLFTGLLTEHQTVLYHNVGPEHAIQYHGMILDCIRDKNAELAAIYSRMHIENSLQKLLEKTDEDFVSEYEV